MRLGSRLFLAYFFLVGLGTLMFLNSAEEQLRPAIRQASEEALVDTANLLAEIASAQFDQGFSANTPLPQAIKHYLARTLNAKIWSLEKTAPDFSVYITDNAGTVLYHTDPMEVGADYSDWLDVSLTLKGEYGARTTRTNPDDELTSSMYIAAPIYQRNDLVGVLTVSQPNASIQPFLTVAKKQIWQEGTLILLAALILGGALSFWLSRAIQRLSDYVQAVRQGEKPMLPDIGVPELAKLAKTTEAMRLEIEGKEYVENYIHTLAHEMKSPLSAIRGAAELLQEMSSDKDAPNSVDRQRFLLNIEQESQRMQRLIDRLLSLAELEKRHHLEQVETLDLCALAREQIESKLVQTKRKSLTAQLNNCEKPVRIIGERFLLQQAISNLLDNAIEFSPANAEIQVTIQQTGERTTFTVQNSGGPIPAYALAHLFERFYSLPRPSTGRKSTGLGLSFVREVMQLHRGDISLNNIGIDRVESKLTLPR